MDRAGAVAFVFAPDGRELAAVFDRLNDRVLADHGIGILRVIGQRLSLGDGVAHDARVRGQPGLEGPFAILLAVGRLQIDHLDGFDRVRKRAKRDLALVGLQRPRDLRVPQVQPHVHAGDLAGGGEDEVADGEAVRL
jgi:hypothetical protein